MIYYLNALIIIVCFYLNYKTDLKNGDSSTSHDNYLSNYLFVLVSLLTTLFSGIRYQTGTDWIGYQDAFENPLSIQYELGYTLFNAFLAFSGVSFEFLLFIVSCFYGLLCYLMFRFCPNKWIALILLNANSSIMYFGGNRQAIASSIATLATLVLLNDVLKSKINKITLIIVSLLFLVAFSFHTSVIPFLFVLLISFWLKNKTSMVIKATFIYSLITILLGAKSPLAPVISTLSKLTGNIALTIYIEHSESGSAETDTIKDIIIIIYNLIIIFLINRSLKLNFHVFPNVDSKRNNEYVGVIVNLIIIFYFIFCLYLGVSRDTSGRLLLYGRIFEAIFFGSLNYQYALNKEKYNMFNNKIIALKAAYADYNILVNSVVVMSLVKIYFTFVSNGYYLPYRTILFPGTEFY